MTSKTESIRESKKLKKRQRIQDAAIKVLANMGYYNTTVSLIAKEAGVADGTLYLYFQNKDELLIGIFEDIMDRFIREGLELLKRVRNPIDQLKAIVSLHLSKIGTDPHLARIFQIEFRHDIGLMRRLSGSKLRDYFSIIEGIIRRAQSQGLIRPEIQPWITAKILFGALDEMATNWVLSDKNQSLDIMATPVLEVILNGMCRRGEHIEVLPHDDLKET